MKTWFRFILIGLISAAFPGEIGLKLMYHRAPHAFLITMANYVWFIAIGLCVGQFLRRRIASPFRARLAYFLLYGCIGLSIEWLLLHVYPFQILNPAQLMMFSFWGGMLLLPWIMVMEEATPEIVALRRQLWRYLAGWNAVALLPFPLTQLFAPAAVPATRGWALFVFGIGVLGMDILYFRYFRSLWRQEALAPAEAVLGKSTAS